MVDLLHGHITDKVLRAYYKVYNGLIHTYPEYIYENALVAELRRQGLRCGRQEEYQVYYKEWMVGVQRLDILVAESVCLELKVKPALTRLDFAQLLSYLKTVRLEVGLLLNFGSPEPGFQRAILTPRGGGAPGNSPSDTPAGLLFPELAYEVVNSLFEVHRELGPGFVHRIYANACHREVGARGLMSKPLQEMTVFYRGEPAGEITLGHLLVEGCILVFPVAIADVAQIKLENLRAWMASQGIRLGILANFAALGLEPVFLRA